MSYDAIIQEMRSRPIDVCYTDLSHRYPWEAKFQSRSWLKLIKQPELKIFVPIADKIYKEMDRGKQHFPTVTLSHNQLVLEYCDGNVRVRWAVSQNNTFSFSLFHWGKLLNLNITKLEQLASFACDFLNGDIAILKGDYVISDECQ